MRSTPFPHVAQRARLIGIPFVFSLFCFLGCAFVQHAISQESRSTLDPILLDSTYLGLAPHETSNVYTRVANKAAAALWNERAAANAEDSADIWFAPNLIADREKKVVHLLGEMTDMNPGEPMEFFVISEKSGHGYEALTITFADPEDVHKALEFIGLKAGTPVVFEELQFWPKGDRVTLDVTHQVDGNPVTTSIESFGYDNTITNEIKTSGLVFVGSRQMPHPTEEGVTVYGASRYGPKAIASNFNCVETVLDLPERKQKADVYGEQIYNGDRALPNGKPILLSLKPMAAQPAVNLTLNVETDEEGTAIYSLKDEAGQTLNDNGTEVPHVLAAFERLTSAGKEPYLTVDFSDDTTLATLKQVTPLLKVIDSPTGVRIDKPPEGQIYYESYSPPEQYRVRDTRPTQPWEYHVTSDGSATLIYIGEEPQPDFSIKLLPESFPITSADDLGAVLKEKDVTRAMFIYGNPSTTQGELLKHIRPYMKEFGTIFVYDETE